MSTNQCVESDYEGDTLAQLLMYLISMPVDPGQPAKPLVAVAAEDTLLQLQEMLGGTQ